MTEQLFKVITQKALVNQIKPFRQCSFHFTENILLLLCLYLQCVHRYHEILFLKLFFLHLG